jgi:hypothetical protein
MTAPISYLTKLYIDFFGTRSSVFNTICGIGGSAARSADAAPLLHSAEPNQKTKDKVHAAWAIVSTTTVRFTRAAHSATSMTRLLASPAVMNLLFTANNMNYQIGYAALASRALTSKSGGSTSLANTRTDVRWNPLAQIYDFCSIGGLPFQQPTMIASIANAQVSTSWQINPDTVSTGLLKVLASKAQALATTSIDQILDDSIMRTILTATLGVPHHIVFQSPSARE